MSKSKPHKSFLMTPVKNKMRSRIYYDGCILTEKMPTRSGWQIGGMRNICHIHYDNTGAYYFSSIGKECTETGF